MVASVCFLPYLALSLPPVVYLAAAASEILPGKVKSLASDRDLILGEQRIKHKMQRVDLYGSFCSSNRRKNISSANTSVCGFASIMKVFKDYHWRTTALIF